GRVVVDVIVRRWVQLPWRAAGGRRVSAMERCVEPEWLDVLTPEEPRAQRSRRDLQRVNAIMRNAAILATLLQSARRSEDPCVLAELGAGDGTLMLAVARRLGPSWHGSRLTLIDVQRLVERATLQRFAAIGWQVEVVAADASQWLASV